MKKEKQKLPSDVIKNFLDSVEEIKNLYETHYEILEKEGKKLQDFLHDLEFSQTTSEKNKVATALRNSRRTRRESKDIVLCTELFIEFLEEPQHKKFINELTNFLGKQRRKEDYVQSDRHYVYRVNEEPVTIGEVIKTKKGDGETK